MTVRVGCGVFMAADWGTPSQQLPARSDLAKERRQFGFLRECSRLPYHRRQAATGSSRFCLGADDRYRTGASIGKHVTAERRFGPRNGQASFGGCSGRIPLHLVNELLLESASSPAFKTNPVVSQKPPLGTGLTGDNIQSDCGQSSLRFSTTHVFGPPMIRLDRRRRLISGCTSLTTFRLPRLGCQTKDRHRIL